MTESPLFSRTHCDHLVADVSQAFASAPLGSLDTAIEAALERVAHALDIDHAAIVDCRDAEHRLVFTHRWAARGVPPLPPWLWTSDVPATSNRLSRGLTVRFTRRGDIPIEAVDRVRYARLGVTSGAVVPLAIDDRVRASVWLSTYRRERPWPPAVLERLTRVATMLSIGMRLRWADSAAHVARVAAIGGLAASLAHELNQPLTAIRSNAQAGQRFLSQLPQRTNEMDSILVDIVADVTRAGEIIDRMRGLLRNAPLSVRAVDLNDVVRTVTKILASDVLIRRVTVAPVLDPNLPPIRADRIQVEQVVLNLLQNALEAMDRDSRSERRVTIGTRVADAAYAELAVHDTGPGLGPVPDRWFEPFQSGKQGGLGIGLSITRMIVEAHGGSITADNNDIGGATFEVRLPIDVGVLP